MKQYKIIYIETTAEGTEEVLNELAEKGWKLICSYAWHNKYLVLERDIE